MAETCTWDIDTHPTMCASETRSSMSCLFSRSIFRSMPIFSITMLRVTTLVEITLIMLGWQRSKKLFTTTETRGTQRGGAGRGEKSVFKCRWRRNGLQLVMAVHIVHRLHDWFCWVGCSSERGYCVCYYQTTLNGDHGPLLLLIGVTLCRG